MRDPSAKDVVSLLPIGQHVVGNALLLVFLSWFLPICRSKKEKKSLWDSITDLCKSPCRRQAFRFQCAICIAGESYCIIRKSKEQNTFLPRNKPQGGKATRSSQTQELCAKGTLKLEILVAWTSTGTPKPFKVLGSCVFDGNDRSLP